MILEICANSYQSAVNANIAGAHRIELCSEISVGGTTPSYGLLKKVMADIDIPVHVLIRPRSGNFTYSGKEFDIMKDEVGIVNCARGGVIDEVALVAALDAGKVLFAGLDVFENEPNPEIQILMHSKISLTPHIGAATLEAQDRIGTELASQIISLLKNN